MRGYIVIHDDNGWHGALKLCARLCKWLGAENSRPRGFLQCEASVFFLGQPV